MATRITYPIHKKARYGLTPGKTYTADMMAFVKADTRCSWVEPAWRIVDDLGRSRWVPCEVFEPDEYGALPVRSSVRTGIPVESGRSLLPPPTQPPPAQAPEVDADDLAAQWEAALSASGGSEQAA